MSRLDREEPFGLLKLGAVIVAGEQVPVHIGRHGDGRMAHALLHHLQRQFEAAVLPAIDAPRGIEMA